MKKQRKKKKSGRSRKPKLNKIKGSLRQMMQPKAFRIDPPSDLPKQVLEDIRDLIQPNTHALKPLEEHLAKAKTVQDKQAAALYKYETQINKHLRLLADIANGLWRLKNKMVDKKTSEPLDEMQKAFRHFESVWDAMKSAGININEHEKNSPFDSGLALNVLSFQPMSGLKKEVIIETIKPSIFYKDRSIQTGQVIVGTPVTSDNDDIANKE